MRRSAALCLAWLVWPAGPALAAGGDDAAQALQALDRAGRALAALGCTNPRETKLSEVAPGDTLQAIDCRSFRVALATAHDGGAAHDVPMSLVALDSALPLALPDGLAVGAAAASVQARLGPPTRRHGASFGYLLDPSRPAGDAITFEVDAGRVSAITWNWRVD